MTPEEKKILVQEIPRYIKENCYYTDGSIKYFDLWPVGWVAAEFQDRKNAMRVLINNEYGLLGNLLNKLARSPDASITRLMERSDLEVILKAIRAGGNAVLQRNDLDTSCHNLLEHSPPVCGMRVDHKSRLLQCHTIFPPAIVFP